MGCSTESTPFKQIFNNWIRTSQRRVCVCVRADYRVISQVTWQPNGNNPNINVGLAGRFWCSKTRKWVAIDLCWLQRHHPIGSATAPPPFRYHTVRFVTKRPSRAKRRNHHHHHQASWLLLLFMLLAVIDGFRKKLPTANQSRAASIRHPFTPPKTRAAQHLLTCNDKTIIHH